MEKLHTEWDENGAVLLQGLLDTEDLSRCREIFTETLENPTQMTKPFAAPKIYKGPGAQYNIATGRRGPLDAYKELFRQVPVLAEALRDLWGSKNVWFFDHELFQKKFEWENVETGYHQDTIFLPFDGQHLAVLWITFEACPKEHSLGVVKASHKLPPDLGDEHMPNPKKETLPREEWAAFDEKWKILSWDTKSGDVIAFHPRSVHGGGGVTAAFPERNTLCLRLFGDDCSFYLPKGDTDGSFSTKGKRYKGLKPGDHMSNAGRVVHLLGPGLEGGEVQVSRL